MGARLFGGRWNPAGRPTIYRAASPGLAVLEVLVPLDAPAELMPDDYRLPAIDIPDRAAASRAVASGRPGRGLPTPPPGRAAPRWRW
ncbi:MAG: RES domain-containing protein [Caulobacteraceae bacterium]